MKLTLTLDHTLWNRISWAASYYHDEGTPGFGHQSKRLEEATIALEDALNEAFDKSEIPIEEVGIS